MKEVRSPEQEKGPDKIGQEFRGGDGPRASVSQDAHEVVESTLPSSRGDGCDRWIEFRRPRHEKPEGKPDEGAMPVTLLVLCVIGNMGVLMLTNGLEDAIPTVGAGKMTAVITLLDTVEVVVHNAVLVIITSTV